MPEWGNISGTSFNAQATRYTAIRVPKGTTIYVGKVGSQNGAWVGGKSQVLFEKNFNIPSTWKIGEGYLK